MLVAGAAATQKVRGERCPLYTTREDVRDIVFTAQTFETVGIISVSDSLWLEAICYIIFWKKQNFNG